MAWRLNNKEIRDLISKHPKLAKKLGLSTGQEGLEKLYTASKTDSIEEFSEILDALLEDLAQ